MTAARRPWFPAPRLRRLLGAGLVAAALATAAPLAGGAGRADGTVTLSIVGTTDLHGYVFPRDGRGGLALLGGYMANLRAARAADGGGVVLVDAGDTWLGGVESNMSEGAVVVDAYNALGYTAAAIGNHDLEFGAVDQWPFGAAASDDLRGALKARAAQARFPFLAANLIEVTTGAPVDWPNVRPSALVTVAGVRVGLVGVMTYDALSMTLASNVGGLATAPLVASIVREAAALRTAGAQVVVVVAHAGGTCGRFEAPGDLSTCDDASEIFDVARRLPPGAVDVIVAGHTHDAVAHRVSGVPIVQAYSWGRAFSRVDVQLTVATGAVGQVRIHAPQEVCAWQVPATGACAPEASAAAEAARYEGRVVTPSAAVREAMAPALRRVQAWRDTALGVVVASPISRGPGDAESPLGNLFADALAAAVPGADAALSYGAGPGGLRGDLPAGPLTLGALFDLFPFDNRVVAIGLTGAALRALVVDHLRRPRWRARALGVSGLRVAIGCRDRRDDVVIARASGQAVADGDHLTVAVTDFLAARARSLQLSAGGASGVQVRDAAVAWVRARRSIGAPDAGVPPVPRWQRTDASVAGCDTARP